MTRPWYREFFGLEFCEFAEQARAEASSREVRALSNLLTAEAHGRTVIDLGCGLGVRAIGLAKARFQVIGIDLSEAVIAEARLRAHNEDVEVQWEIVEPCNTGSWPRIHAQAAICGSWFGCGEDSDQRRLLRAFHRHLQPGGLLVLDCLPFWLRKEFLDQEFRIAGKKYRTHSNYSPATGRSEGIFRITDVNGGERSLAFSMRIYSPVELRGLMKESGYSVTHLDTERMQIVGHSLPAPPASLAVTSWATPPGVVLDLRYADDEAELLRPTPSSIWRESVAAWAANGDDLASHYAVDDPFGGERGASSVGAHFGISIEPGQLTFGPGVTSLLHDLAGLADGGLIAAPQLVHGDIEAWAASRGNDLAVFPEPAHTTDLLEAIEVLRPALLHLDRPTFTGQLLDLDQMEAIARAAARAGAVVLVDESAAPYVGPRNSSARVAPRVDNLVVVRGFTKAYTLCGLRVGYAIASSALAERVRELVSPLQVSEPSLDIALRLLAAGDIFQTLRERIHWAKPKMIGMLGGCGAEVLSGHPDLPWVALRDRDGEAIRTIEKHGIRALQPALAPSYPPRHSDIVRLTVPLSRRRMDLFEELLTGSVSVSA